MMKRFAKLSVTGVLCAISLIAPSCAFLNQHTHSWTNYIVKNPTCTEKGLIEKLCEECGEKQYEDLMPNGHDFQNGYCNNCGQVGYSESQVEPIPMPENSNNTAAWTLEKVYQFAKNVGVSDSYSTFISTLSYGSLDNIYIDNLGLLHLSVNYTSLSNSNVTLPLTSVIGKVSPTNAKETKFGYISKVQVLNDQLTITYTDGLQTTAGKLTNDTVTITKFGINPENELVLYYSNNTIAFAGKISEGKASDIQAAFVYRQDGNGYAIHQIIDLNESVITIPISHQGKPITTIDSDACILLINKAVSIVIPESITNIHRNAFIGLTPTTTLYFEGSLSTYTDSFPTNACTYFKGSWSYVNGVPTPNF